MLRCTKLVLLCALLLASPAWAALEEHQELLLQNAAAATANGADLSVEEYNTVGVELTISASATVTWEGSVFGTYSAIPCTNKASGTAATTATATGLYQCDVSGLGTFRARVSTYASGTVTAYARSSTAVFASSTSSGGGGAVTNAGTFAVQESGAALTALQLIDNIVSGTGANISQINGVTPLMGNGVTGTGSPRVTIASDNTAFSVNAVQSGTWTVQPGNTANSTPWLTSSIPATAGGASACYLTSAATTNATNCKASAGQIYGYDLINTTSTLYYLRLYNLGAAPTCSSATGFIRTIPIPASTTGAGVERDIAVGEAYGTGIGFCLTAGGSSTDNTAAATGVYISIQYK